MIFSITITVQGVLKQLKISSGKALLISWTNDSLKFINTLSCGSVPPETVIWGIKGGISVQVRDGFDDFDYLRMAEELVGREEVMKVVNKVTTGMLQFTEDYRVLEAARDEIVQLILDNQKWQNKKAELRLCLFEGIGNSEEGRSMVAFCKAKSRFYDKMSPKSPYYCIFVV